MTGSHFTFHPADTQLLLRSLLCRHSLGGGSAALNRIIEGACIGDASPEPFVFTRSDVGLTLSAIGVYSVLSAHRVRITINGEPIPNTLQDIMAVTTLYTRVARAGGISHEEQKRILWACKEMVDEYLDIFGEHNLTLDTSRLNA